MVLLYILKIVASFKICTSNEHHKKSFSLYYYDLARSLFVTLAFTGILSTGWFGIPLAPHYFTDIPIDNLDIVFTILSALGSIWGIMAYREFTRTRDNVLLARSLCKKIDPNIGDRYYSTFNRKTKKSERGYVPLGPTDFWDRQTVVPDWLDKGKYWHILLRLQIKDKEIINVSIDLSAIINFNPLSADKSRTVNEINAIIIAIRYGNFFVMDFIKIDASCAYLVGKVGESESKYFELASVFIILF